MAAKTDYWNRISFLPIKANLTIHQKNISSLVTKAPAYWLVNFTFLLIRTAGHQQMENENCLFFKGETDLFELCETASIYRTISTCICKQQSKKNWVASLWITWTFTVGCHTKNRSMIAIGGDTILWNL